ncbi:MAG: hypothetical protein WBF75_24440 [Pseudonocardiaceae bacterium]
MTTPGALTRETVRTSLIQLLSTDQHPGAATLAATPLTLAAIADTRRDLAALHGRHNPAAHHTHDSDRHAALSAALGDIAKALLTTHHHRHTDPWRLRAGLTVLATVALAWLDTLPHPDPQDDNPHESYEGPVAGHDDPDSDPDDTFTSDVFGDESPF